MSETKLRELLESFMSSTVASFWWPSQRLAMLHLTRATAAWWDLVSPTHTISKAEQLLIWKLIMGEKQLVICEKPLRLVVVSWSQKGRSNWQVAYKWCASEEKPSRTTLIVHWVNFVWRNPFFLPCQILVSHRRKKYIQQWRLWGNSGVSLAIIVPIIP